MSKQKPKHMRSYPNRRSESDMKALADLNAKPWQVELLNKNPNYVYWGNTEDSMSDNNGGWRSPQELEKFSDRWNLDEYNELVNFYFELSRASHRCEHCNGEGLNPETKQLSDDWYDFEGTGRKWSKNITSVEVEALVKRGRINDITNFRGWYDEDLDKWIAWVGKEKMEVDPPQYPTAEEVNIWASGRGFGHDAINKWICVEARAKHLGIYGKCEHCEGNGHIYDEPDAKVSLQLWFLHPRKGASRGVYIKNIEENDIPEVIAYLKEAAERNANRFSKL